MRKEVESITSFISLNLLLWVIWTGFSLETRRKIYARVRAEHGKLQSEKSGISNEPLECAHINHDPTDPNYDHESNGVLLTVAEHLDDHFEREENNGLTLEQNRWAIAEIRRRLKIIETNRKRA